MKRAVFILAVLLIGFSLVAKNRAVLIGVSHYPENSGWWKLSSQNDIKLIRESLPSNWEMTILEDENAKHHDIIKALTTVVTQVCTGDTVLVHFSGHGQQMLPLDDLSEPDFLDEAIVPYDACKTYSPSYHGENHLRDDELADLINMIRDKTRETGLVIVTIDACHSDSMHKGEEEKQPAIYRGSSDIFGETITEEIYRNRYKRDTSKISCSNTAHVAYISACQAHSTNQELKLNGEGYGSLSFAVAKSLTENGFSNLNVFLDKVVSVMAENVPYQKPGIRTSFDYTPPTLSVPTATIRQDGTESPKHYGIIYVFVTIAVIIAVAFILWKKIKK